MRGPWKGFGMLAAHVLITLVSAWYCMATGGRIRAIMLTHLPMAAFLALVFGQACILGFWCAYSSVAILVRLTILVIGVVTLEVLEVFAIGDNEFLMMISIAAGVIAVVMGVVKRKRADLVWLPPESRRPEAEVFRFSISRLMLFTAAVAVPVALARNVRQTFGLIGPSLFVVAVWSLGFVVLAVAATWAALGTHRPGWRSLGVLVCASALSALFAYGIGEDRNLRDLTYFILITAGQSVVVLATLLRLRLAGYRLEGRLREPADSSKVLVGVVDGLE